MIFLSGQFGLTFRKICINRANSDLGVLRRVPSILIPAIQRWEGRDVREGPRQLFCPKRIFIANDFPKVFIRLSHCQVLSRLAKEQLSEHAVEICIPYSSQQANSALTFGITGERKFGGSKCSLFSALSAFFECSWLTFSTCVYLRNNLNECKLVF